MSFKLLHVSDTHGHRPELPEADLIVHTGDICNRGTYNELVTNLLWLSEQKAERKLFCPGNHDMFLDVDHMDGGSQDEIIALIKMMDEKSVTIMSQGYFVFRGKLFGVSSYQPIFMGWGFNVSPSEQMLSFEKVLASDPDFLVTHCPPNMVLDVAYGGHHVGSPSLSEVLYNHMYTKDKMLTTHLFGHLHESRGIKSDNGILHVNSATGWTLLEVDDTVSVLDSKSMFTR